MTDIKTATDSLISASRAYEIARADILFAVLDEVADESAAVRALVDIAADARVEYTKARAAAEAATLLHAQATQAYEAERQECERLRAQLDDTNEHLLRHDANATRVRVALTKAGIPEVEPYPVEYPIESDDDHERLLRAGGRVIAPADRVARLASERDQLRASVAELEARPVLTVGPLADALDACGYSNAIIPGLAMQLVRQLGPVTLPAPKAEAAPVAGEPDAATVERVARAIEAAAPSYTEEARAAIAALQPAAPPVTLTAATVEELLEAYSEAWISHRGNLTGATHAAIRAVLARARVRTVDPERLVRAFVDGAATILGGPFDEFGALNCADMIKAMRAALAAQKGG